MLTPQLALFGLVPLSDSVGLSLESPPAGCSPSPPRPQLRCSGPPGMRSLSLFRYSLGSRLACNAEGPVPPEVHDKLALLVPRSNSLAYSDVEVGRAQPDDDEPAPLND